MVVRVGPLARCHLGEDDLRVPLAKERQLPQVPVPVRRSCRLGVLDGRFEPPPDQVLNLMTDLLCPEGWQVGEGAGLARGRVAETGRVVLHLC